MKDHPNQRLKYERTAREKLIPKVFEAYGNKCACCGETIPEFLTIDHIHGGGRAHRKELKSHSRAHFFRHIIRAGYPKDLYRLLCWNCNCTKGFLGYCPHEKLQNKKAIPTPEGAEMASW